MRPGASSPPPNPDPDASWWAELEEQLGHHDTAERYRGGILPPGQVTGGREGDEIVIPLAPERPAFLILQPKTPGQRCVCSAPDGHPIVGLPHEVHRASGREGEIAVCPHGRAWKLVDPSTARIQSMFLRWVELHGLARWWAARKANR